MIPAHSLYNYFIKKRFMSGKTQVFHYIHSCRRLMHKSSVLRVLNTNENVLRTFWISIYLLRFIYLENVLSDADRNQKLLLCLLKRFLYDTSSITSVCAPCKEIASKPFCYSCLWWYVPSDLYPAIKHSGSSLFFNFTGAVMCQQYRIRGIYLQGVFSSTDLLSLPACV